MRHDTDYPLSTCATSSQPSRYPYVNHCDNSSQETAMSASKSGAIHSAWESGIHFPPAARTSDTTARQQAPTAEPRMSPRSNADAVDLLGGLLFVLAFLAIVWL